MMAPPRASCGPLGQRPDLDAHGARLAHLLLNLQLKVARAIVDDEDAFKRIDQALATAVKVVDIAHIALGAMRERDHDVGPRERRPGRKNPRPPSLLGPERHRHSGAAPPCERPGY